MSMATFQGGNNQISHKDYVDNSASDQLPDDVNVSMQSLPISDLQASDLQASESLNRKDSQLKSTQLEDNTTPIDRIYDLSMLENSPIVVIRWVLPPNGKAKFTYISENISQFGYSAQEILSGEIDWLSLLHPDDRANMQANVRLAIENKVEKYSQLYRLRSKLGHYHWIENQGNIIRAEDGRIRYFQALLNDVSERKTVELELNQKTTHLEILHETTLGLVQRLDLKSLFDSLVKRLATLVNADFASLNIVNKAENKLEMVAIAGFSKPAFGSVDKGEGLLGTVWQTKKATYIENYQTWEKRLTTPIFAQVKSVASIPLISHGQVIGVMAFGNKHIYEFDGNTKALLQSFAQIATVSIENARIFEDKQIELQERQRLELVLESERNALAIQTQFRTELASLVEDSLSGKFDGSFYQTILERAIAIVPGSDAGSLLIKGSSDKYYFKATVGYDLDLLMNLSLTKDELYRGLSSNEPIKIFEGNDNNLSVEKLEQMHSAMSRNFKVALTIPISVYGKTVAFFSLDSLHNKDAFNDNTIYLAKIFANQVAALWQRNLLEKNLIKNQNNYRHLFLESNQYSKELQILDKLRSVIASKLELNELLNTVCKSIVDIFDYGRVCIGMRENNKIVMVASHGHDESLILPKNITTNNKLFKKIQETKEAIVISNDFVNPVNPKNTSPSIKKTLLVSPLLSQGEIIGLLAIGCESRNIGKDEQSLVAKVIDQLQIAIDNATLHSKIKKDLIRTKALYKVSSAMQENNHFDNYMDSIIEPIREALSSNWAVIYKMNFEYGTVEHVSKAQLDAEPLATLNFEQLNSGLTGWAIRRQQVVYSSDISQDDREHEVVTQLNKSLIMGSALVIPLIYQNEVFGTLATVNKKHGENFSSEDMDLLVSVANQASAALAQYELRKAIEFQAFHDTLTGLANRIYMENSLTRAIVKSQKQKNCFATMFLDLDGFKNVNDTLGHNIGDELLKAVANRLTSNTDAENTLARMGGDEFAVIINNLEEDDKTKAINIAENYLSVLQKPFQIGRHTIKVGASIGISFYPNDGKDISSLLKHADSAMYQAKYSGKNSVSIFTSEIAQKLKERIEMENDLRKVIEEGGLELHYQPQICLEKNKRIGVEALLRWNHATKGFISPDDFIPVSEESKLILDIGKWVIQEACRQNAAWQAEGYEPLTIAINISALQFESSDFIDIVSSALEDSGLDPSYLELEVTESIVMQDIEPIIDRLLALKLIGIKVSIDDFGTGYSSLQYLQRLPIDKLKVDRSFINEISSDNKTPILDSIFILAQSLGLMTVAEGVETQEQLDYIRKLGCNEVQGYYYSKAVPASEIWKDYTLNNKLNNSASSSTNTQTTSSNSSINITPNTPEQPDKTDIDDVVKEAA